MACALFLLLVLTHLGVHLINGDPINLPSEVKTRPHCGFLFSCPPQILLVGHSFYNVVFTAQRQVPFFTIMDYIRKKVVQWQGLGCYYIPLYPYSLTTHDTAHFLISPFIPFRWRHAHRKSVSLPLYCFLSPWFLLKEFVCFREIDLLSPCPWPSSMLVSSPWRSLARLQWLHSTSYADSPRCLNRCDVDCPLLPVKSHVNINCHHTCSWQNQPAYWRLHHATAFPMYSFAQFTIMELCSHNSLPLTEDPMQAQTCQYRWSTLDPQEWPPG